MCIFLSPVLLILIVYIYSFVKALIGPMGVLLMPLQEVKCTPPTLPQQRSDTTKEQEEEVQQVHTTQNQKLSSCSDSSNLLLFDKYVVEEDSQEEVASRMDLNISDDFEAFADCSGSQSSAMWPLP